jgi:hypothetical protein
VTRADLARLTLATVHLPGRHGRRRHRAQGVIVPGRMIVTAAHCVQWDNRGGRMAGPFGDTEYEKVIVGDHHLLAAVYAVEPVSDVAVLGVVDGQISQEMSDVAELYDDLMATVNPIPLCTADHPIRTPFPVHIGTHDQGVVAGQATYRHPRRGLLLVEASCGISGGTSGGPIVTNTGHLLAVVSTAGRVAGEPGRDVTGPSLRQTIPQQLLRLMLDPRWGIRAMQKEWKAELRKRKS